MPKIDTNRRVRSTPLAMSPKSKPRIQSTSEMVELSRRNAILRERVKTLRQRELALQQTCRMLSEIVKTYAVREAVVLASVKTLGIAYGLPVDQVSSVIIIEDGLED